MATKKSAKRAPAQQKTRQQAAERIAPAKKSTAKKSPVKKSPVKNAGLSSSKPTAAARSIQQRALKLPARAAASDPAAASPPQGATAPGEGAKREGLSTQDDVVGAEAANDVAPCRLVDHGEGRFSLCFDDFKMPELALFTERGLQGGGYTWECVADSLVRIRRPDLGEQLSYDSEASMFVAVGNRPSLMVVARLLQESLSDARVLKAALDAADPDRLE